MHAQLKLSLVGAFLLIGCDTLNPNPNPNPGNCPAALPAASTECTAASCSATTSTKTFSEATLDPATSASWLIVNVVSSELFDNQNPNVSYGLGQAGGLTPSQDPKLLQREQLRASARARHSPETLEALYHPSIDARIRGERTIRAMQQQGPIQPGLKGTAIKGRTAQLLPDGVLRQDQNCSASAPACGETSLCVIPAGGTDGTCENALTIRFRNFGGAGFQEVSAAVRKVGTFGAIVVDDADTVADGDVDALLKRFDERIAPVDHMLFGKPEDQSGADRDQNGVTILFLTSKVTSAPGQPVGFFLPDDLRDPQTVEHSNGADLLYMQPPGGNISLDSLSGTTGHEYQHLINYYAKVLNGGSSQEDAWLDEALSTFAEDVLGYGSDAFTNVSRYLDAVNDTSLTGFGLINLNEQDADSAERRGMGGLFIRLIYERAGGATFGSGGADVNDGGGIAAVKALVQNTDTGVDVISSSRTGRSLHAWLEALLTAVAIDGADYNDVSCNAGATFAAPETDEYTGFQRGLDLRGSFTNFAGSSVSLNGPSPIPYAADEIPVPANGGELRTLTVQNPSRISISGPAEDFQLSFVPLPTAL